MPDLTYADCRCRVTWEVPPNSTWQNPGTDQLHVTATIGVGQGTKEKLGEEDQIKTLSHLPEASEANFRWKGIGLVDGQNWAVRAGIRPTQCKIAGITYNATWKALKEVETEPEREIEIALGLPQLTAMA